MASFKLTVKEREPADSEHGTPSELVPLVPLKLQLQCSDIPAGNASQFLRSASEDEAGPLSPLGS